MERALQSEVHSALPSDFLAKDFGGSRAEESDPGVPKVTHNTGGVAGLDGAGAEYVPVRGRHYPSLWPSRAEE